MQITTVAFTFTPFIWRRPRVERCVEDTGAFLGPFRIFWINRP